MEGNPLGRSEREKEPAVLPLGARSTEFAADFEAPLKEQAQIMRDAKKLLDQLESNPNLKSEAISKVIAKETARYLAAKAELKRLQDENAEKIRQQMS